MKAKLQWRPYEARDANNIEYLQRKVTGSECSQLKREATYSENGKTIGAETPKIFRSHVMLCAQDAGHGAAECSICPSGFYSSFGPVFPCYFLFLPFGMGMFVYSVPSYLGCNFLFLF